MKTVLSSIYSYKTYFVIFLVTIIFSNCKKKSSSDDLIQSPFKVTYEIITSVPLSTSIGTGLTVSYTNSAGGQSKSLSNKRVPWIKEEIITDTYRPLPLIMNTDPVVLNDAGVVTGNIYINGIKKASFFTTTSTTTSIGGYNVATLNANYLVK